MTRTPKSSHNKAIPVRRQRTVTVVCATTTGDFRPLETGAVLGMRKERKGKFSLADNNDTKSLKDNRSFQNLWASSPCEISPSLVPLPLWPMRMSLSTSPAAKELQDQTELHTFWHNWFGLSTEVPR